VIDAHAMRRSCASTPVVRRKASRCLPTQDALCQQLLDRKVGVYDLKPLVDRGESERAAAGNVACRATER